MTLRVKVKVDISSLQILGISEVANSISIRLNLALVWTDHRLAMHNLNKKNFLNTLTADQSKGIWIPQIIFQNTKNYLKSQSDDRAIVTVSRLGKFTSNSRSALENAFVFKGSENPITSSRVYYSDFLCDFDMAMYPFDTQKCSIKLVPAGNSGEFIDLVPGLLNYTGPLELTQYFIKNYTIENSTCAHTKEQGITVSIIFGRKILATILTTYLPTLLLCLVCFSTNYFRPSFFEAIVAVNLTSLLVLTTLFISVFNSLPATAYIKMIDIWLIFILFVPFSEVILHTIMDYARANAVKDPKVHPSHKHPNKDMYGKQTDFNLWILRTSSLAASMALPAMVIIFSSAYFAIGLNHYHNNDN